MATDYMKDMNLEQLRIMHTNPDFAGDHEEIMDEIRSREDEDAEKMRGPGPLPPAELQTHDTSEIDALEGDDVFGNPHTVTEVRDAMRARVSAPTLDLPCGHPVSDLRAMESGVTACSSCEALGLILKVMPQNIESALRAALRGWRPGPSSTAPARQRRPRRKGVKKGAGKAKAPKATRRKGGGAKAPARAATVGEAVDASP